jgi:hypothetical protein
MASGGQSVFWRWLFLMALFWRAFFAPGDLPFVKLHVDAALVHLNTF